MDLDYSRQGQIIIPTPMFTGMTPPDFGSMSRDAGVSREINGGKNSSFELVAKRQTGLTMPSMARDQGIRQEPPSFGTP